ncbi:uncharacterized protein LOC129951804 isoform X2 [Eupeodes corollae]|uniref:uncharacterized protein LOC129951804 isoform X2 n=1 Tax=Eupeodes corollae TaxID=290404 RepID=UPI0024911CBD|nr:uncharacterized protein LOC129951804 isoform X2 [Eupeodes corollae]
MKLILVILVVTFLFSLTSSAKNQNRLRFRYGNTNVNFQLNIEVLNPRGLRVSIPHKDGLEMFSFHGSVVHQFSDLREDRDGLKFAHDVTGSVNGLWVYENKDIELKIGDSLNYWVFLQYKGAGQRFNDLTYTVKKLVSNTSTQHSSSYSGGSSFSQWQTTRAPIVSAFQSRTTTVLPIIHARPIVSNYADIPAPTIASDKQCECNEEALKDVWTKMNATVAKMRALEDIITPLEEKLNSLTETVVELIKNMDIGTRLLLTGNLPSRTNPVEDVRHLIVEKLKLFDLSTTILQAEYKNNGILFDVSSSIDKLRILKRSNDILSKLSYQIIDPDRPVFDVRMARK